MGEKIWKNAHKNKEGASAEFGSEEQGKNLRGRRKGTECRLLLASGILFVVSLLLQLLARLVPGFGEWYAVTVYPVIVGTLGRVSGSVPFSVVEAAAYLLTAAAVWYTAVHLKRIRMVLVRALLFLTGIFFLFTCNCGVNYYRKPFSS